MNEHLLVVKQDKLVAMQFKQHALIVYEELENNQKSLTRWLVRNQVQSLKLILELIEEELYVEQCPSLYFWELEAYANRQLKKRFPVTVFSQYHYSSSIAWPWKPLQGLLVLTGFNEEGVVVHLMDWLDQAEIRVEAIHSTSVLLFQLLLTTWFNSKSDRAIFERQVILFLVKTGPQDIRQLLVVKGVVRTSRFVHLNTNPVEEQQEALLQELVLIEKFAKSQKIILPSDQIHIYYMGLDEQDAKQTYQFLAKTPFAVSSGPAQFTHMPVDTSVDGKSRGYDYLLALVIASLRPASDYLPQSVRQVQRVNQARVAIGFSAYALSLLMLAYAFNYLTYVYETESGIQRLHTLQQEYHDYIERFAQRNQSRNADNYSLNQVRLAVEAVEAIEINRKKDHLPHLISAISTILSNYPSVHLVSLDFAHFDSESSNTSANLTSLLVDMISLELQIEVETGSILSEKIAIVDGLLQELKHLNAPGKLVAELVKSPFNIDSGQQFSMKMDNVMSKDKMGVNFELLVKVTYE